MATTPSPTRRSPQPTPDGQGPRPLRVTPPRRQRRPALIVLALLLVLVSAALTAALFLRVGGRVAVLAVARPVPVGHPITDADLAEVRISPDPALHTIPAAGRDRVVGQVATVSLLPGALVTPETLTATAVPGPGQAVVGMALKPGQMPAEDLKSGDRVMLVRTPPTGAGQATQPAEEASSNVLVERAQVFGARPAETGDSTVVSVVVRRSEAVTVARAQATGQVSLVLVPAGQ